MFENKVTDLMGHKSKKLLVGQSIIEIKIENNFSKIPLLYLTDYIPDQLFVALDSDPVFYSNGYVIVDEMLYDYDNTRQSALFLIGIRLA